MRRNVRRLNREIGHVNLAAGALNAVKSVPVPSAPLNLSINGKKGSSPPTIRINQNDDYYQANLQGDSGDDVPGKSMTTKKRSSGRKAANLSGKSQVFSRQSRAPLTKFYVTRTEEILQSRRGSCIRGSCRGNGN